MKNVILFIILVYSQNIFCQNNEIGLTLFKFERNSETYNVHIEPKLITGLNYTRYFDHLQWFSGVDYGENEINDKCNSCVDHFSGIGVMKEINLKSGIGYGWNKKWGSGTFLTQFRLNAIGGWLNYSGHFSGGWCGYLSNINRQYVSVGGEIEFGVGYQLPSNLAFRLDISASRSHAWMKNKLSSNSSVEDVNKHALSFPRFSIGYRF